MCVLSIKIGKGAAIETEAAWTVKVVAGEGNLEEDGEEGEVVDTMDVDAVQAATAALANLLCYSDINSVRLVAAGGIGVLVGLVSSYRPHNLLDFDQVGISLILLAEYLSLQNPVESYASHFHRFIKVMVSRVGGVYSQRWCRYCQHGTCLGKHVCHEANLSGPGDSYPTNYRMARYAVTL